MAFMSIFFMVAVYYLHTTWVLHRQKQILSFLSHRPPHLGGHHATAITSISSMDPHITLIKLDALS